ncbi:MAG: winged helix-turn-helix domain-containing protein [bacterium]
MLFLLSMKIQFDDFFLDDQCYVFERSGVPISLRPKVFDLLAQLLRHRDRVVRREELVEAVWQRTTVGPGSLSGLVNELRQALGEDRQSSSMIRTVHARGYQFVGKVDERSSRLEQGGRGVESLSGGLAADAVGRECRALIEQVSEVGARGIILEGSLGQGVAPEASGVTAKLFETAHEMGFELHCLVAPEAAGTCLVRRPERRACGWRPIRVERRAAGRGCGDGANGCGACGPQASCHSGRVDHGRREHVCSRDRSVRERLGQRPRFDRCTARATR